VWTSQKNKKDHYKDAKPRGKPPPTRIGGTGSSILVEVFSVVQRT